MFPLRDSIPARHPPLMNYALIAVNVLVFWLQISLPEERFAQLIEHFALVPAEFVGDGASWPVWTFLTSQFLHASGMHLLSNMWMLWIFGDNVEDRMGSWRYLAFYLLGGVLAGAVHAFFNAHGAGAAIPTIGASGAIAAVLGAYFLMYPRARVLALVPILFLPFFFEVPAFVFLGVWFVLQIFSASLVSLGAASSVAFQAHIGGFVAGLLLVKLFCSARCHPRPRQRDEHYLEDLWRRMR